MVDYMRPRCKEGVRMFLESDLSDDYTTATSQEAVETLMSHLLDNAIQFTDHGVITVACTEYGDMVRVSVTDTGCGIAPELRDHVFDTFQEMADNMKLKGLGLPICKAIVQLLGGRIWLDTDYHEGTRFIFDLPHMK
jgi:signal transduction histidine kinase